ncbi:MAG: baseplate J/gp47 family protein [Anaerotignum propionicum]|uniref:baseplate assembly protein n=1 Tax=Anaerotignum propionicum TaxID=28446 RepID=UPI002B1F1DB8|nr:baseplate J/gp47 family protein [Anaerotignum propionicum]MEA5057781.1 baseplate J/gp47 family protein [Anaerotignum propionicum]
MWIADIIIQERVNIDFSAKQNLPRYSEGEYLDSLAEIFKDDVIRLEPEKAKTTLRFTLSVALEVSTIIPAGTRVTVDGTIVFMTLNNLTIPAGSTSGDVAAECLTAGEIGNGFVPGQINQLIDIFPYFGSVQNITETAGGADEESDAAFYERMRGSMEAFSTAGPMGAYEYYAKSASALIVDVKATSPSPGVVDVRVLLQGGELPSEEILQEVSEKLTADKVRPFTDHVMVSAPEIVSYNMDFTYYIHSVGAISPEVVKANVEAAVKEFRQWQAEKMGRDLNPSYLVSLLMQTGIKRVEIRSPAFSAVAENAVAQVGTTMVVDGGVESE